MDAERSLLSKAIQTGQIERLITEGIDESHFYNQECKDVWVACVDHVRKYRASPSFDAVKAVCPDFAFDAVPDALAYVQEQFIKQTKRREAIDGLIELGRAVDDPERIMSIDEEILELGKKLAAQFPSGNASKFSDMWRRIETYDLRIKDGIVRGFPYGIPAIDDETNGIQPSEYVSVVGWQGTGKSTLAQHICFSGYLAGFTPLIISLEMEAEALFRKFDTMATNFQYKALKNMELGRGDREKWEKMADRAKSVTNDIIVLDRIGRCTVERVHALAEQYSPDLMVVDYVSLMEAPRGSSQLWEKVTYITQGLKQVARSTGVPIIGVAQTNVGSADDGARLENISYSRSIGQDSDVVLGLNQDKEGKMKARNEMDVRLLKNRDGVSSVEVKMFWDPSRGIYRTWQASDMFGVPHTDDRPQEAVA